MRITPLLAAAIAVACAACLPATSLADGPYEPNETAALATAPVTTPLIVAGLETPQDEDWYLLHPQGVRQIGVQATLAAPCEASYRTVRIELLDADYSRYPVDTLRLGYDGVNSKVPRMTATTTFTSQPGHRYLLHVTQSGCRGAAYSLAFAPNGALGMKLAPTKACQDASTARNRANYKLTRLRAARKRARGARRKALGVKIALQAQQVTQAKADAKTICTRAPLTGYPWD